MNEDLISDLQKRFHENDNRVGDPSVVQWNLPCKIYMYEFAFKYKYNLAKFTCMNSLLNITT